MKLTESYPYSALMQIIRKGEENAVPAGQIVSVLGLPDTRTLRSFIENLREEECVLSSERGYYFPKDKDEALRWRNHMIGVRDKYNNLAKSADRFLEGA